MIKLSNYQEWRECIEVACGIPLTSAFIKERLAELTNGKNSKTQTFESLYGADHLAQTIAWFQQAQEELAQG